MDSVPKQPDDLQFIQGIEQRVMGLPVCTIPGEQAEHGFHAVAPLHAPGAVAVGAVGNFGVVLAVDGNAHDVAPVEATQLRQMISVKALIVGE